MRPSSRAVRVVAAGWVAVTASLLAGVPALRAGQLAAGWLAALILAMAWDWWRSSREWAAAAPTMTRRLPPAFAIGVAQTIRVAIDLEGTKGWRCWLHDHADPSLATGELPLPLTLAGGARTETSYSVIPQRRGVVSFAPAHLRLRSRWGLCELLRRLGPGETRRVYPDFAQVARYAWLAGDRRLQEIGIKSYSRRGEGTDFKQLSEYRVGDSVRHIDWKATLRTGRPVVREFQDERDQCVLVLLDCGRRMRADDRQAGTGAAHFDQVLNAVMLLAYVALKQGDAVGALTFGTPPADARSFAPRKGAHALSGLMSELYSVQPSPSHADYVAASRDVLLRQTRRALVVVITNFRDEDSRELGHALRLLRSRHLVLLASLRERIVRELLSQPLTGAGAAVDVASAHLYEQSRRDAFIRLSARDALMVDAEPERLGVELVNRYHAVKRAGLI